MDAQRIGSREVEVIAKAKRRSFSATYKKKILTEIDAAAASGTIGEVLRREGLYSSTVTRWRRERDTAVHKAFSQKRGPEPKHNPLQAENEKLRRQNVRLQEELRKAEIVIAIQKKWHSCWGTHYQHCRTKRTPDAGSGGTRCVGGRETSLPASVSSSIECLSSSSTSFSFTCSSATRFLPAIERGGEISRSGLSDEDGFRIVPRRKSTRPCSMT